MKVSELIRLLKKFDPDLKVVVYDHEHAVITPVGQRRLVVEDDELVIYP